MIKRQPGSLSRLIFISMLAAVISSGCAAKSPDPAGGKAGGLVHITKIEPRETDTKTEIVIEAADPILQYTSFQLTEPLRLIVDITDASLKDFPNRISVSKAGIGAITPAQMDNIARLEIGLMKSMDTKVYQDGGKLIVELAKPIEEAKTEPEIATPKEDAVTPPEPEQAATASIITSIKATADREGARVVINANGSMRPNTFMVQGRKLVVDIPNTTSRVRPSVIPVRKGGLDKVRVGQHAAPDKKVRVVMDLVKSMEYTVTPDGNALVVALTAGPAAAEEKQPKERAAAVKKEKAVSEETERAELPTTDESAPPIRERAQRPRVDEEHAEARLLEGRGKFTGRKISLDLQDADLVNVLRLFAEIANLNVVLSPEVKGKVTVRLVNIPWDQAMDIILKMNGFGYAIEDNILRIASHGSLAREADEELRAKEAKKKAEDLITRIIPINYATAGTIEGTIKKSLSARGETVVDTRTNTLIVKDIAKHVDEVVTLIKLLDKPIPQIMIEARIVEASLNFNRSLGIQWGTGYQANASFGNPTGFTFPNSIGVTGGPTMGAMPSGAGNYFVNMPAAAGAGTGGGAVGFQFGSLTKAFNLDLVLSALESTGEGKVISTPRVSALDNKEAKIEQGISIPFATSSAGGATNVQFVDAKLSLSVTPHATPDNKIFLKIQATKNAPDVSLLGAGGQPSIRKNEATTEILLADGETAVIGGILIVDRGQTITKVPFFGDLPLIGWLFRSKTMREDKRELIIFITPRLIRQDII